MYFLFSGEGSWDFGTGSFNDRVCEGADYSYGPMALFVDKLFEQDARFGYSFIDTGNYGFVSKHALTVRAKGLHRPRTLNLAGKKRPKETSYFYFNARALALFGKDKACELEDLVVCVLFRDSDGSASAGRGLWRDKLDSMLRGFQDECYAHGVPMIPKPKSEAWVLCAVRNQYQDCERIEDESGNDNSPNSLKKQLADFCGNLPSQQTLCDWVTGGRIAPDRINMTSFTAFRKKLEEVLSCQRCHDRWCGGGQVC